MNEQACGREMYYLKLYKAASV